MSNLRRLQKEGAFGPYGFYESIDYTAERLPEGQKSVLIRAFMTHHQGMSLVSLANILQEDLEPQRFHSDPAVQATELLLQERIPVGVPAAHPRAEEVLTGRVVQTMPGMITRVYESADLSHSAHAITFEWNLQRDAHDCRFRLFTLRRERGHALA